VNRRFLLVQTLAALFASAVAWAAEPGTVRVSERGCTDYDLVRLDELVAIEVETLGSELSPRPSEALLECRADAVSIRVAVTGSAVVRSRRVETQSMDRAAATRLLALTITELLAQLWSENPPPRSLAQKPQTAAPDRDSPPPDRDAGQERVAGPEPGLAVSAGAAFRSMLEPRAGLFGGSLRAEYAVLLPLSVGLDLEGAYGSVRSEHAAVNVTLASAATYAAVSARLGRVAIGGGPGVRFGWINLSPEDLEPNSEGSDVSGAWGGPILLTFAKWAPDGYLLYSSLELGAVTLPVVGTFNGAEPEVELKGLWFAAGVGVGVNL
jgi:hypothetical protein